MFSPRGGTTADAGQLDRHAVLRRRANQSGYARAISELEATQTWTGQSTRPLRVAHFSDTYEPRRDGIITSLQTLVSAMAELGHQGLLVVPGHREQDNTDNLLRLRSLPCGVAQFRIAAWPRIRHVEQISQWAPDVVHVHTPGPVGLLGVFAARHLGIPLVQTYHTDLHAYADAYRLPSRMLSGVVRCYARRLGEPSPPVRRRLPRVARRRALLDAGNHLLLGGADIVLVPTPAVLSRHGLPVDSDRLFLAPAGVTIPTVPADAGAQFRAQYSLGEHAPVVLFVGRINREKNVDLLIDAFARLRDQVPQARLVLVGAIYDQRLVKGLLQRAGIGDQTVCTGELEPEQVARAYAAADVFAFPSQTDTQGLVLQEAALAGLPAVLADPALYETGPLARQGVLTEPDPRSFGQALAELLTDPVRRHQLGRAARQRAEANTPAQYAARVAALYARVIGCACPHDETASRN